MVGKISPECCKMMTKLAEADFYAQDLKLYLDTHPDDTAALKMYREAVRLAKQRKAEFLQSCYPLCAEDAGENGKWNWLCGIWM